MPWPVQYVAGIAKKGWVAWREQRLDLSPSLIRIHLRNYYRELRHPALPSGDSNANVVDVPVSPWSVTGCRCLLVVPVDFTSGRSGLPLRADRLLTGLLAMGHGVTVIADAGRDPGARLELDPRVTVVEKANAAHAHLKAQGRSYSWVVIFGDDLAATYLMRLRAYARRARVIFVRLQGLTEPAVGETGVTSLAAESYGVSGADLVIAGSHDELIELRALEPSTPILVMPLGSAYADELQALFPTGLLAENR